MRYEIGFEKEELFNLIVLLAKQSSSANTQEEENDAENLLSKIKYAVLHSPIIL